MKPWDAIIPQHEQEAYRAAGFGRRTGLGSRPALLIIDVQYRTVGTEPRPFFGPCDLDVKLTSNARTFSSRSQIERSKCYPQKQYA